MAAFETGNNFQTDLANAQTWLNDTVASAFGEVVSIEGRLAAFGAALAQKQNKLTTIQREADERLQREQSEKLERESKQRARYAFSRDKTVLLFTVPPALPTQLRARAVNTKDVSRTKTRPHQRGNGRSHQREEGG